MLLPAAAGVLLTAFGWWFFAWTFSGSDDPLLRVWLAGYQSCPFSADEHELIVEGVTPQGVEILAARPIPSPSGLFAPPDLARFPTVPLTDAWHQLDAPIRQLFDMNVTYVGLAFLLLCGLWTVAVWALVGGALTRMATFELAREERISWSQAFRHSLAKWHSYFAAPLLPLLGVLLMAVPMGLLGLLGRTNIGLLVLAVIWPLFLAAGLLMAIFLIGLLFGWPLMWAAIATESGDSFDALNRAYSYVYQRALKYALYGLIAAVLSVLGGWVVWMFASAVVHLAHWGAAWGSGAGVPADQLTTPGKWAVNVLRFWDGIVRIVAIGFVYSSLWSAAAAIYLLLRQDVDGTPIDDVQLDEPQEAYGLPPLQTDEAGVAGVADEAEPLEPKPVEAPPEPAPHSTGLA